MRIALLCLLLLSCTPVREGLPPAELCPGEIVSLALPQASVFDGTWESSPMHDGYVSIAPEVCARFEIDPAFDRAPRLVQAYTAFPSLDGEEPVFTTPTLAGGDSALIIEVTAGSIVLKNISGTEFLYRVVAR